MHSALLLSQSIDRIKWFSTIALLRTPSELGDRLYQTWSVENNRRNSCCQYNGNPLRNFNFETTGHLWETLSRSSDGVRGSAMVQKHSNFPVLCIGSNVECIEQHYTGEITIVNIFCTNFANADDTGTNFLSVHSTVGSQVVEQPGSEIVHFWEIVSFREIVRPLRAVYRAPSFRKRSQTFP